MNRGYQGPLFQSQPSLDAMHDSGKDREERRDFHLSRAGKDTDPQWILRCVDVRALVQVVPGLWRRLDPCSCRKPNIGGPEVRRVLCQHRTVQRVDGNEPIEAGLQALCGSGDLSLVGVGPERGGDVSDPGWVDAPSLGYHPGDAEVESLGVDCNHGGRLSLLLGWTQLFFDPPARRLDVPPDPGNGGHHLAKPHHGNLIHRNGRARPRRSLHPLPSNPHNLHPALPQLSCHPSSQLVPRRLSRHHTHLSPPPTHHPPHHPPHHPLPHSQCNQHHPLLHSTVSTTNQDRYRLYRTNLRGNLPAALAAWHSPLPLKLVEVG